MYSISETAKLTGITAYTLRYYEKIGVLPTADRHEGIRRYSDEDLQYIRFIHGLKQTGMSLEEITTFNASGCLLTLNDQQVNVDEMLEKRIQFLQVHIAKLDLQMQELAHIKSVAQEKRDYYQARLKEKQTEC